MTPNQLAALRAIDQAQQALKQKDKQTARQYAVQAAQLAPELEEVWLMMAALASPRASIAYIEKALQINPNSERARKGMHWAIGRLRKEPPLQRPAAKAPTHVKPSVVRPHFSYLAMLVTIVCLVAVWAVWQGVTPAQAFINSSIFTGPDHGPAWALADVPKPTYTLTPSPTFTPTPTDTPTPTFTPTATFTLTPTDTLTFTPSPTATETLVPPDTPTPLPTDMQQQADASTQAAPSPVVADNGAGGTRWVDVDLTHQMVYAYEGNTIVNSFLVSTGTWQYPTVTGQYHIYVKLRYTDMSGPGYYLPNVPYTMYFYEGYALHGTYWHHNFGTPMSHGCVNLSIPDSEWLYNFASVGTLVNIHY